MTPQEFLVRRQTLGLTQEHLARVLGVSTNTVARWERGELTIARPEMVRAVLDEREREMARWEYKCITLNLNSLSNEKGYAVTGVPTSPANPPPIFNTSELPTVAGILGGLSNEGWDFVAMDLHERPFLLVRRPRHNEPEQRF